MVHDIRCRVSEDAWEIGLTVTGDVELELYSADERKSLLEEALGRPVTFVVDEQVDATDPAHPSYFT